MKFLFTFLVMLIPLVSVARSDGYFLWHEVLLKDVHGGYVDVTYSAPYLHVDVKYGVNNINSGQIKLPTNPDLGRIRFYSVQDRSGEYSNFLEIGLAGGECSNIRVYLSKDEVSGTRYVNCVANGVIKKVSIPTALVASFAEIVVKQQSGTINLVYPYSERRKLPSRGSRCEFDYEEQLIDGVVGGRFSKGRANVITKINCL